MPSSSRLPARFPVCTKYVLEGRGLFVRRYIEFPSGRRVHLATRKALTCTSAGGCLLLTDSGHSMHVTAPVRQDTDTFAPVITQ